MTVQFVHCTYFFFQVDAQPYLYFCCWEISAVLQKFHMCSHCALCPGYTQRFCLCFLMLPSGKLIVKSLSRVRLFVTPWTVTHQAPPSMGFSRQEYRSGLPFPSPREADVPHQISLITAEFPLISRDSRSGRFQRKSTVLGWLVDTSVSLA